jgi:hypothetical protein
MKKEEKSLTADYADERRWGKRKIRGFTQSRRGGTTKATPGEKTGHETKGAQGCARRGAIF